ncbi:LSU ribosomal protein L24p (L26e) [Clostridiaceae bacterium JG1575]|nr:LSU ribosomal protein L24p (L26e) [Clostridiaceae bacterium JG1575]
MKVHVRKNDKVVVISGNDKGKKSEVLAVNPKKGTVLVKDVNMVSKHLKASKNALRSEIVKREAPIHASKVMLWCEKCGKAVRPSYRFQEDGAKIRYCKACDSEI